MANKRPESNSKRSLLLKRRLFRETEETLWRAKVTRSDAAQIDNELLQDQAGIHHPELENVLAGAGE
jgi:hypothetical protein